MRDCHRRLLSDMFESTVPDHSSSSPEWLVRNGPSRIGVIVWETISERRFGLAARIGGVKHV